jgi:hypothetical protein
MRTAVSNPTLPLLGRTLNGGYGAFSPIRRVVSHRLQSADSGRSSSSIVVLDMDSSENPTYGEQEGSAYNGHFGCTCVA